MEKLRDRLARRLRELMEKHPALDTQVKVSKRAHTSQSTIGRVLSKEAAATLDVVEDLGRAFGLRPPALILFDELDAEILGEWARLGDEDRKEVLRFAGVLARRSRGQNLPILEFQVVQETDTDVRAANMRASSQPPETTTNAEPQATRRRRRTK